MKKYPYIEDEKKIRDFTCDKCKTLSFEGFNIEWRVTCFVGDNEFEKECLNCRSKRIDSEKKKQKEMQEKWDKHNNDLEEWENRNQHIVKKENENKRKAAERNEFKKKHKEKYKIQQMVKKYEDMGVEVKSFTQYQFRINGKIDIYPDSFPPRYFHLEKKEWGDYVTEKQLFKKFDI